jgi:methylglutaconyl-CoA hydratase
MINEITMAVLETPKEARAICIQGEGPSFSAGADLAYMSSMAKFTVEENKTDARALLGMFTAVRDAKVPVVASVQGAAVGGGAGLVAAADIAVGLHSTTVGFTEVKLGLIPAVISPFVIEKIGSVHARRYFLTGERFDGRRAAAIGLFSESVETQADLDALVDQILAEIVTAGPTAVAAAKELVDTVAVASSRAYRQAVAPQVVGQIASLRVGDEAQKRMGAFLAKSSKKKQ